MLNERRDGRTHPFVERQSAQESVKVRLAAGAIEANGACPMTLVPSLSSSSEGADGPLPALNTVTRTLNACPGAGAEGSTLVPLIERTP